MLEFGKSRVGVGDTIDQADLKPQPGLHHSLWTLNQRSPFCHFGTRAMIKFPEQPQALPTQQAQLPRTLEDLHTEAGPIFLTRKLGCRAHSYRPRHRWWACS